jgi:hypothetical protein
MTKAAVDLFAARTAAARVTVFGVSCSYAGHTFSAIPSTERDARQLRDGGFALSFDRVLRFPKSSLPVVPKTETAISIGDKKYRISEVKDVVHSQEWLLSLVQAV